MLATQAANALEKVERWADAARVPFDEDGTVSRDGLLKIARHLDYEATEDTIAEFVRRSYLPDALNLTHWPASLVTLFIEQLNRLRRWCPTPSVHDARKSAARLQVETFGPEVALGDAPERHTVEVLLHMMAESEDRASRECCLETLRYKMDRLGWIEE
jgi:hypothetical protein